MGSPVLTPRQPSPAPHKQALDAAFVNYIHKQPVDMSGLWGVLNKTLDPNKPAPPLSPDIEDRRNLPPVRDNNDNFAGRVWDEIKSGRVFSQIKSDASKTPPPVDSSFYNPAKDASRN